MRGNCHAIDHAIEELQQNGFIRGRINFYGELFQE